VLKSTAPRGILVFETQRILRAATNRASAMLWNKMQDTPSGGSKMNPVSHIKEAEKRNLCPR